MDIKLWKPLITKKQSIVFDVFGYRDNESYRPILIYEDVEAKQFYYVIAKPININQDIEIINDSNYKNEVLMRYTLETGIINNYMVDCSQILRIDREVLEDVIDINLNDTISPINQYYIERIMLGIRDCLLASPPYISLLSVSYDNDKSISTYSVYINDLILDFFNVDSSGYEIVDRNIYRSAPSVDSPYWNERYENGIKFCRYFLNEFLKEDDLTDFDKNESERYKMLIIKEKASNIIKDKEFQEIRDSIPTQVMDVEEEHNEPKFSTKEEIKTKLEDVVDCEPKEQCVVMNENKAS